MTLVILNDLPRFLDLLDDMIPVCGLTGLSSYRHLFLQLNVEWFYSLQLVSKSHAKSHDGDGREFRLARSLD